MTEDGVPIHESLMLGNDSRLLEADNIVDLLALEGAAKLSFDPPRIVKGLFRPSV